MERWRDALRGIDAEPPEVRQRPEVRYAAAAAAEHLGEHSRVMELLADLEQRLPLLAERIRARRARASLSTSQAQLAFEYYRKQSGYESRLRVAQAQVAMGDRAGARTTLTSLLATLPKKSSASCRVEAKARSLLSDVLPDDAPHLVARELRWLALQAPLCPASEGADERLEALGPGSTLSKADRAERARAFAEAGRIEETERELFAMSQARGTGPEPSAVLAIRGVARYEARKELDEATEFLTKAAEKNPARSAEWLYAAARARMRAGATQEAIALFERVQKVAGKGALGEVAEYKRAQLIYAAGRFEEAVRAYDAYLARYGKRARFAAEATEGRSVAWVVTGKAERAAQSFAELARNAKRLELSRYQHLESVALEYAGKREQAQAGFRRVMNDHPLSFAALAAAARLEAHGVAAPSMPAAVVASAAPGELLVKLPPDAELLHRIGLDREAELALADVERQVAQNFPDQGDRALCMLYRRLASAERCFRVGYRAATWEELSVTPRSDRRWLWECVYPRPYAALVQHYAADQGVESDLIYAVMRQESGFRPEVVSPAKAVGLLQILPSTGERLAGELGEVFDAEYLRHPPVNVRLGARYLRKLIDVFDGSLPLAVASYNAGPNAVLNWLDGSRDLDLDLFVARIPYSETRSYVERVLSNYARYRYLTGGEVAIPRLAMNLPTPRTDGVELY
jgi:soluble lytic murein transglycosylase